MWPIFFPANPFGIREGLGKNFSGEGQRELVLELGKDPKKFKGGEFYNYRGGNYLYRGITGVPVFLKVQGGGPKCGAMTRK